MGQKTTMDLNIPTADDRGQVGIGTLIVFIAMVLVAAIAAGVLINTAGQLQETAGDTGDDTQSEVSDRVVTVSATGDVSGDNVTQANVTIRPSAGADDIDLADMTIEYFDAQNGVSDTLTNNSGFTVENITGVDGTIMSEESDRAEIQIALDSDPINQSLSTGDEVEVTFVTSGGGETVETLSVPEILNGQDKVDLLDN